MRAVRAVAARGDADSDAALEKAFNYHTRPRPRLSSSPNHRSSRSRASPSPKLLLSPDRRTSTSRRQASRTPKPKSVPKGSATKRSRVGVRAATACGQQVLHQRDVDSRFPMPYPGVEHNFRQLRTSRVANVQQDQKHFQHRRYHSPGDRGPPERREDDDPGSRKLLTIDHSRGPIAAAAGRRRRTRPRSAVVAPLSRSGAASDSVKRKDHLLSSTVKRKQGLSKALVVRERGREGGKGQRPASAPSTRGGHDHQDGGVLMSLSRMIDGSSGAPRELHIMKWVVLRETYLTKLHGVVFADRKRANSSTVASREGRTPKPANGCKQRSPKLFALLTELLIVLRRITVEIVEAVERWRRGNKERPFIWGSSNYLVKAACDTEFLSRLPGLEEHLGVAVSSNPFLSHTGLDGRSAVLDRSSIRSRSGNFPLSASGSLGVSAERVAAAAAVLYREVRRARRQRWEQEENEVIRPRYYEPARVGSPSDQKRRPISSSGRRSPTESGHDRYAGYRKTSSTYGERPTRPLPSSDTAAARPPDGDRNVDSWHGEDYRENRRYERQLPSEGDEEGEGEEEGRQHIRNPGTDDDHRRESRPVRGRCSAEPELPEAKGDQRHFDGPPKPSLNCNHAAVEDGPRRAPPFTGEHYVWDKGVLYRNERHETEVSRVRDNSGDGGRRRVNEQFERWRSTGSRHSRYARGEAKGPPSSCTAVAINDNEESHDLPPDDQSLDYQNGGIVYGDDYRNEQEDEGGAYRKGDQNLDYYHQEGGYYKYTENERQQGNNAREPVSVDESYADHGNPDDDKAANPNISEQRWLDDPEGIPEDICRPSHVVEPRNSAAADNTASAHPPDDKPVEQPSDLQYQQRSSESAAAESVVRSTPDPPTVVEETKSSDDPDPLYGSHGRRGRRGSPFNLVFNMCDGMLADFKCLGMGNRVYRVGDETQELQPMTLDGATEMLDDDTDDVPTAATNGGAENQEKGAAYTPLAQKEVVASGMKTSSPPPVLRGTNYASLTKNIVAKSKVGGPDQKKGSSGSDGRDAENSKISLRESFSAWAERTEGRLRHRDAIAAKHHRLGRLRQAMCAWEIHRSAFLGRRMAETFAGRFDLSTRFFVRYAFDALRTHAKGAHVATRNRSVMERYVSHMEQFPRARLRQAWRRWAPPKMRPELWQPGHAEALRTLWRHWGRGRLRGAFDTWRLCEQRQHEPSSEPSRSPINAAGRFAALKGKLKAAGSFANLKAAPSPNAPKPLRTSQAFTSTGHQERSSTTTSGKDEDSLAEWMGNDSSISVGSPGGEEGSLRMAPALLVRTTNKIGGNKSATVSGSPVLSPSRSFRGLATGLMSMRSFRDGRDRGQTKRPPLRPTASFGSSPSSPSSSPAPPPPSALDPVAANEAVDAIDALQVQHFAANRAKFRGEAAKLQSRENAAATIQWTLWRAPRERQIAARASNSASLIQRLWRLQLRRKRAGFRLVRAWRTRIRARIATLDRALVEAAGDGDLRAVGFLLRPPAKMVVVGSGLRIGVRGGADVNAVAGANRETALHAAAASGGGWDGEAHRNATVTETENRVKDAAGQSGPSMSALMTSATESSAASNNKPARSLPHMDGQRGNIGHWLRGHGDTSNWVGVIQALVEAGAAVEARDRRGFTPIMTAAEKGSGETVATLATLGAEVDAKEVRGGKRTPLLIASQRANAPAVAALLEYGARVNLTVGDRLTPLHEAVGAGSIAVAEMLVRSGANVNATNESAGMTPLHLAVANDQHAAARLLVHSGANVCLPDARGLTCLRLSIEMADAPTVALLLAAEPPADLSVKDENGGTVLHAACRLGLTDIARLLLEHGADPHVRDSRGRTPELVALDLGHCDCAGLFYNVDIHSYAPYKSGGDCDGRRDDSSDEGLSGNADRQKKIGRESRMDKNGRLRGSSDEGSNETDEAQRTAIGTVGQDEGYTNGEAGGEGALTTKKLRESFAEAVAAARLSSSVSAQVQEEAEIEGASYLGEYVEGVGNSLQTGNAGQKMSNEGQNGHRSRNGSVSVDAEEGAEWEWSETAGWICVRPLGALIEEKQDGEAEENPGDGYHNEPRHSADWQQPNHDGSYDDPDHRDQQGFDSGQGRHERFEIADHRRNSNIPGYRNSWEGHERARGAEHHQKESGEGEAYDSRESFEAALGAEKVPAGVAHELQQEWEVFTPRNVNYANGGARHDGHSEDPNASVTRDSNAADGNEGVGVIQATAASLEGSSEGAPATEAISSSDANNRGRVGWGGTIGVVMARNRWIRLLDRTSGHVYYQNERSGLTQWEVPQDAVVLAPPVDVG